MAVRKFFGRINGLSYKFRLPAYYLLLIVFGWSMTLIPPLNECSGGLFVICFPISMVVIILLGVPGMLIIDQLDFIIPRSYYSWMTHSENLSWVVFIRYAVGLMALFTAGFVLDRIRRKKVNT